MEGMINMSTKTVNGCFKVPTAFLLEEGIQAAGFTIVARQDNRYIVMIAKVTCELVFDWMDTDIVQFTLIANNQPVNEGILHLLARQLITTHSNGFVWDTIELHDVGKGEFIDKGILTRQLTQQHIPAF